MKKIAIENDVKRQNPKHSMEKLKFPTYGIASNAIEQMHARNKCNRVKEEGEGERENQSQSQSSLDPSSTSQTIFRMYNKQ